MVQKSGEMVVRTLDPRQFIRLASETVPKINIDSNVSANISKAKTILDGDKFFCHLHTSKHIYYENFFANIFSFLVLSGVIIIHYKTKYKTFCRFPLFCDIFVVIKYDLESIAKIQYLL